MAGLSVSGFYSENFYFAGFPPREKSKRKFFYNRIFKLKNTVVLLERPYALSKILDDLKNLNKRISISFNLGMPNEKTYRGYLKDFAKDLMEIKKEPFVIVIEGKYER
jgi:16S rRNA (cytidine1402-2'-O)-methyltransferase